MEVCLRVRSQDHALRRSTENTISLGASILGQVEPEAEEFLRFEWIEKLRCFLHVRESWSDRFVFTKDELQGIVGDDRRILDLGDPEKPINFVPQDRKKSRPEDGMDVMDDEGEEPIPERPLPGPDIILNYGMPLSVVFEALDLI